MTSLWSSRGSGCCRIVYSCQCRCWALVLWLRWLHSRHVQIDIWSTISIMIRNLSWLMIGVVIPLESKSLLCDDRKRAKNAVFSYAKSSMSKMEYIVIHCGGNDKWQQVKLFKYNWNTLLICLLSHHGCNFFFLQARRHRDRSQAARLARLMTTQKERVDKAH